jgi:CYTH domain-containing protein
MEKHELERAYLINKIPNNLEKCRKLYIKSVWLSQGKEALRIQMKKLGKKTDYNITKKYYKPSNSYDRKEVTIKLTKGEFIKLDKIGETSVEQIRYFYPLGKYMLEIDIYKGKLDGYSRIEVEFNSYSEYKRFSPPSWFGKEIKSDVNVYVHKDMAHLKFSDICKRYQKFEIRLKKIKY